MKQLDKKTVTELEQNTTHVMNSYSRSVADMYNKVVGWYHRNGVNLLVEVPNFYDRVKLLSKKLGVGKPNYFVSYSGYRNAVWGFELDSGNQFVIYYSTRGLSVQYKKGGPDTRSKANTQRADEVVQKLYNVLVKH